MPPILRQPGVPVDLAPFWEAWDQIRQERVRLPAYTAAAEFWNSANTKLTGSADMIPRIRTDLEVNSRWGNPGDPGSASSAFYQLLDAGVRSIQGWLDADTDGLRRDFRLLADRLGTCFEVVQERRLWLLEQEKFARGSLLPRPEPIVPADLRGTVWVASSIAGAVADAVRTGMELRDDLRTLFDTVRTRLAALPRTQSWLGPATAAGAGPGDVAVTGQPDPVPGGPGGAGPAGTGPAGAGPADGPANATAPGGPGAGPDAAPPPSTPDSAARPPGGGQPGGDQPGGELPGGAVPSGGPGRADSGIDDTGIDDTGTGDTGTGDTGMPRPPATDPELAGAPSATATPTPTTPPGGSTSVPGAVGPPNIPTGGNLGPGPTGSALPLTLPGPTATPTATPFPGGLPVRRDGAAPPPPGTPRNSTVDGPRFGAFPGGAVVGETPAPRAGPAGSDSGSESGGRNGFYPPVMPPMLPPGGTAGGGIRPGEAEFPGGLVRQVGGPDTWRAGLRSQLLGRTGDHRDDEPDHLPPARPPAGDEVLDDELWQVPAAAPVAPQDPPPRRGRSWGPG